LSILQVSSKDEHNGTSVASEFLHIVTALILTVFVLELLIKVICFRKRFITCGNIFDTIIVCIDVAMEFATKGFIRDLLELVIVLRMWRVGEIIMRVIQAIQTQAKDEIQKEQEKTFYAEERLRAVDEQLKREHSTRVQLETKLRSEKEKRGKKIYSFATNLDKSMDEQFMELSTIIKSSSEGGKWDVYRKIEVLVET